MVNLNVISVSDALTTYDAATGTEVAAVDAQLTAVAAVAEDTLHTVEHTSSVFPGNTNLTCTLTALDTADTYSDYVEIADSAATTLSEAFATIGGHITSFSIESLTEVDTVYMVEFSCCELHTVLTTIRFAGGTRFTNPIAVQRLWMPEVPVGEKVYYRMKTGTAVADAALVNFRYHTH